MKKLLIRVDDVLPPKPGRYISGVGRSNIELLKGLKQVNDPDLEIEVYSLGFSQPGYKGEDLPYPYHRYILPHKLNEYCSIESAFRRFCVGADLFHLTGNFDNVSAKENFVITIHDMYMYHVKEWNKRMFEACAKNCKGIVTCSEFSKQDIIDTLKVSDDKVTVIPWGISGDIFYPRDVKQIETVKEHFGVKGRYFFACSCSHPRKNAKYILSGFREFAKENNEAVVVLAWNNFPQELRQEYQKEIGEGRIIIIDYLTDEELATLYSGAIASLLVSSLEGFGFPILESMACGTPCITCRNSSLTEIGSDKAYFVNEKDSEAIADAMKCLYDAKIDTSELISYANSYSWHNTATKYVEFYKQYI